MFNAATAIRPTPAEVIEGLERHKGVIKSQYQLYSAYPPDDAGMLRDDETGMRWRCRRDDGSVMVKVWKRAAWGDQQREGPRILDFLDRTSRSEERRVGKGQVSTCRSRVSPYHQKKKK